MEVSNSEERQYPKQIFRQETHRGKKSSAKKGASLSTVRSKHKIRTRESLARIKKKKRLNSSGANEPESPKLSPMASFRKVVADKVSSFFKRVSATRATTTLLSRASSFTRSGSHDNAKTTKTHGAKKRAEKRSKIKKRELVKHRRKHKEALDAEESLSQSGNLHLQDYLADSSSEVKKKASITALKRTMPMKSKVKRQRSSSAILKIHGKVSSELLGRSRMECMTHRARHVYKITSYIALLVNSETGSSFMRPEKAYSKIYNIVGKQSLLSSRQRMKNQDDLGVQSFPWTSTDTAVYKMSTAKKNKSNERKSLTRKSDPAANPLNTQTADQGGSPQDRKRLDSLDSSSKLHQKKSGQTSQKALKRKRQERERLLFETRNMVAEHSHRGFLSATLKGLVMQIIYVIVATVYTTSSQTPDLYRYSQAIGSQLITELFPRANGHLINFFGIKSMSDIWQYIDHVFLTAMMESSQDEKEQRKQHSVVLGRCRIRQLRVKNNSCTSFQGFDRHVGSCISRYNPDVEDTAEYGPRDSLCWRHSTAKETGNLQNSEAFYTYPGSGYYIDLSRNIYNSKSFVSAMKKNLWIDRQTCVIFLYGVVYNIDANVFAYIRLTIEMPSTGMIYPSSTIVSQYYTPALFTTTFYTFCLALYSFFNVFYFLRVIREGIYFKWRVFKFIWNYVDVLIFIASVVVQMTSYQAGRNLDAYQQVMESKMEEYVNIETYINKQELVQRGLGTAVALVYLRTFQYLNFNKITDQFNTTIRACIYDVVMFGVVLLIVMYSFAYTGKIVFGDDNTDFANIVNSLFTLFRTMFGSTNLDRMLTYAPSTSPIFFMLYIYAVTMILMNLLLAILNSRYTDVKSQISYAEDEMQMTDYLAIVLKKIPKALGMKGKKKRVMEVDASNEEYKKIKDILTKCGFSQLEIGTFFNRYNIDKNAIVGPYDLSDLKILIGLEKAKNVDDNPEGLVYYEQEQQLEEIQEILWLLNRRVDLILDDLDSNLRNLHQ